MNHRIRWGILGTGNIARQFAAGVKASELGEISAVGSRTLDAALTFAQAYEIPTAVESYEALVSRSDVDAVYISLPNTLHHQWTIAAVRAGKHVLCEKPFAVTVGEAEEMFDAAQRAGRVVMEAFMYRCHPQTLAVQAAVLAGAIGRVRHIRTSFCYRTTKIAGNIRFDPQLAGGALMDIGCYCLSFSILFGGSAKAGSVTGNIHPAGVDDLASGYLQFDGGAVASFTCGMTSQANNIASICGEEGYIEIPVPWKPAAAGGEYTIARATPPRQDFADSKAPPMPPRQTFQIAPTGDVYAVEADDFAAAILEHRAVRVTRQETLSTTRWLEKFRRQLGLGY